MSSNVLVDYDPHIPPPHPGPSYTRFVCLSDTHSRRFPVPPGDILLHAGDLCSYGRISDLRTTIEWLKSLPHPVKIIIAGNHDLCLDRNWGHIFDTAKAQDIVRGDLARKAGIVYLEHESVQVTTTQGRTWKVYGSPAAPIHVEGSFQYSTRHEALDIYSRIPLDTDVLLTHTPPYEVHDLTSRGKHAGCEHLAARVRDLVAASTSYSGQQEDGSGVPADEESRSIRKSKLHVWGHIHEAYGATVRRERDLQIVQVNAAIPRHGNPIIVDLPNGF